MTRRRGRLVVESSWRGFARRREACVSIAPLAAGRRCVGGWPFRALAGEALPCGDLSSSGGVSRPQWLVEVVLGRGTSLGPAGYSKCGASLSWNSRYRKSHDSKRDRSSPIHAVALTTPLYAVPFVHQRHLFLLSLSRVMGEMVEK